MRQRGLQYPQLFVPGGNIPVAELGVQDRALLSPTGVSISLADANETLGQKQFSG